MLINPLDPPEACCMGGPLDGEWFPVLQPSGVVKLGRNKIPYEVEQSEAGAWYYLHVKEAPKPKRAHAEAAMAPQLLATGTPVTYHGRRATITGSEMDTGVRVYSIQLEDGEVINGVLTKEMRPV